LPENYGFVNSVLKLRLNQATSKIRNSIPEEWYYIDFEMTVPADFDLKTMLNLLEQCKTNDFWNTP